MEAMTSASPSPLPRQCPACKAFMGARARSCVRCRSIAREAERRAKAEAQMLQKARERELRELTRLRDTAKKNAWRLSRLQQAIEGRRRSSQLPAEEWEPIVHAVFGAPIEAIADPRQMPLFSG